MPAARIPHLTLTFSAPWGGEGNFQLSADRLQYAPDIFHYIPVPEPDYPIASPDELPAPKFILIQRVRVLSAIDFYDQPGAGQAKSTINLPIGC